MRYHQFIPVLDGITQWRTDYPDALGVTTWQFWASITASATFGHAA